MISMRGRMEIRHARVIGTGVPLISMRERMEIRGAWVMGTGACLVGTGVPVMGTGVPVSASGGGMETARAPVTGHGAIVDP